MFIINNTFLNCKNTQIKQIQANFSVKLNKLDSRMIETIIDTIIDKKT